MKKVFKNAVLSMLFLLGVVFICTDSVYALGVIDPFYYGDHKLTGYISDADSSAAYTVKIGGKTYKGKLKKNDDFSVSIPGYYKIGTSISVTYKDWYGNTHKVSSKVKKNPAADVWVYYVYSKHTKVRGYVEQAHKGDIISIKIGNKTYKTKVKKDAKKYKFSMNIKKAKAGTKMTITLRNKFNQKLVSWKWKVFTSDVVRIGMTKKQVSLLAYWSEPDKKNVSAYSEQWCYDDDGDGWTDTYLYFRNGKVSNWSYSN